VKVAGCAIIPPYCCYTAAIPLLYRRHTAMSNIVLPNFDWALATTTEAESQATTAANVQYRLDGTKHLIPFGIASKKDKRKPAPLDAACMASNHIKLFLAKKLVLGWLYLKRERIFLDPNTVYRLAAYVRYYDEILEGIRQGDTEILQRWWVLEMTSEHSQHSAARVPLTAGLDSESRSLGCTLIDWNLEKIYPTENLALVSNKALDDAAYHVGDWIAAEVEREVLTEASDDDMIVDDTINTGEL
jgi:hypothetical protein